VSVASASLLLLLLCEPARAESYVYDTLEELLDEGYFLPHVNYVVEGHQSPDDGAGGTFRFDAECSPDPGLVYEGDGGCVRRVWEEGDPVRAEWFLTEDDVDDRAAIQEAIDRFNRVDLVGRTYTVGLDPSGRASFGANALRVYAGTVLTGAGPHATTVRLRSGANPTVPETNSLAAFAMVRSDAKVKPSTEDVVISNLGFDVNMSGQQLSGFAVGTIPPTYNAVHVIGPNLLVEDVFVTGYGSNTWAEAFVIHSALAYKDDSVDRTCATVRRVEMTGVAPNLALKTSRYGTDTLRAKSKYVHVAEVTHIAVGGAKNYYEPDLGVLWGGTNWVDARSMAYSATDVVSRTYATLASMKSDTTYGVASGELVKVTGEARWLEWVPDSEAPVDNVIVFGGPPSSERVLPAGERQRGRFLVRDVATAPGSYTRVDRVGDLASLVLPAGVTWVRTDKSEPITFKRWPLLTPAETEACVAGGVYACAPRIPARARVPDGLAVIHTATHAFQAMAPSVGSCVGPGCDPGWDTTNSGENETNRWPCEGGGVESVYLHDLPSNPEGWTAAGRYTADGWGTNASMLHGVSLYETENARVTDNYVVDFEGTAVFMMSWWNKGLEVSGNVFEDVNRGLVLSASWYQYPTEAGATVHLPGCPLQMPRHVDYEIADNVVELRPNLTMPGGYGAAGVVLQGAAQGALTCSGEWSDPPARFDGLLIKGNYFYGAPYALQSDPTVFYPPAVYVAFNEEMDAVRIEENEMSMGAPDPVARGAASSAINVWSAPGNFGNPEVLDIYAWDNRDSANSVSATPVLFGGWLWYLGLGTERQWDLD
jgi:hypothetical protein